MQNEKVKIYCDECNIPLIRDLEADEYVVFCPGCGNRCVLVTEGLNKELIRNYRPEGTDLISCLNCRQIYSSPNHEKPTICPQCGAISGFHKSKLRLI